MKHVLLIGPFPPPVHGMAKNLEVMRSDLAKLECNVEVIDTSPETLARTFSYHIRKITKVCKGIFKLTSLLLSKKISTVYLPPDGGFGLIYTSIFVFIIRCYNIPIFAHHRTFAYIEKRSVLMKAITKVANKKTTHIFLCNCMKEKFEEKYGRCLKAFVVSNAIYVKPIDSIVLKPSKSIKLGYLSNISLDKGIMYFLELGSELIYQGLDVELFLAGPFENESVKKLVYSHPIFLSHRFKYVGPVYREDKKEFFKSTDIFVFPSLYKFEAQPNVVFEAMSHGNVILTSDIACLSEDVKNIFGRAIPIKGKNWVEESVEVVKKFLENKGLLERAKSNSLISIKHKKREAKTQYYKVLCSLSGRQL